MLQIEPVSSWFWPSSSWAIFRASRRRVSALVEVVFRFVDEGEVVAEIGDVEQGGGIEFLEIFDGFFVEDFRLGRDFPAYHK